MSLPLPASFARREFSQWESHKSAHISIIDMCADLWDSMCGFADPLRASTVSGDSSRSAAKQYTVAYWHEYIYSCTWLRVNILTRNQVQLGMLGMLGPTHWEFATNWRI